MTKLYRKFWQSIFLEFIFLGLLFGPALTAAGEPGGDKKDNKINIVVLTSMNGTNSEKVVEDAAETICEELKITGFNVVFIGPTGEKQASLSRTIGDAFDKHQASVAVVMSRTSMTDGTVMLFGRKGLDEVTNLDAVYIEFPLNKDKAELVAFKVSEKAALLSEGMRYSVSPVPIENNGVSITKPKRASLPPESENVETADSSHYNRFRSGLYLQMGTEGTPGENTMGYLGGLGGGIRWFPSVSKIVDIEVMYFPWSDKIEEENFGSVTISLLIARIRVSHKFRLHQFVSVNIGASMGVGVVQTEGVAFTSNAFVKNTKDIKGSACASGEFVFHLNQRISFPFRMSIGGIWPKENIVFKTEINGDTDIVHMKTSLGSLSVEASLGAMVMIL